MNKKELWKIISQLDASFHRIMVTNTSDDKKLTRINKLHTDFTNAIINTLELEHEKWFNGFKGKKGETKLCSCCK